MTTFPPKFLTPAPGIYPGVPMAEYHAWNYASNSRLGRLDQSPAHLQAYINEPPGDTKATRVGRAVHTAILEPDYFTMEFAVAEQCEATLKSGASMGERCPNSGTKYLAAEGWLCGQHSKGKTSDEARTILTTELYETCIGARDSVWAHPGARGLFSGPGDVELSLAWRDEETGVMCKARPDRFSPSLAGGCIPDIKTCEDASARQFERSIWKFGYHMKGAWYLDGAEAQMLSVQHFVLVAVEKKRPYAVAAYRLKDDVIDAGRAQLRPLIRRYRECVERNEWPAYSPDVQDIGLPPWALDQIDDRLRDELVRTQATAE